MGEDILLCQITSRRSRADRFTVALAKAETLNGSLEQDSFIRCNMLFTAHIDDVQARLCVLPTEKYVVVVRRILLLIS